jgi:hypothetical protein
MRLWAWEWAPALLAGLALLATAGAPGVARAAGGLQDCAYAPDTSTQISTVPACASISTAGALHLAPGQLHHIYFGDDGVAAVQVGKLFFYVAKDGRSAPVAGVDGHAVEFHDGLAPSPRRVGGGYKVGYIDQDLNLAIPARWDGGLDFNGGRAEVCRGCHVSRDGDFAELEGGVWGCIDAKGHEVVPVSQSSPDELDCGTQ